MKTIKLLLILTATLIFATACLQSGEQKSAADASPAGAPMAIPADVSCGVCGMFPARYPEWQTQIIFTDNKMVPFDGGKDMFKYLLMMGKFDTVHTREDVSMIWVKDFISGSWFDGKKATYVAGSGQMGPMGKELIPFENPADAAKFQASNGGTIHTFSEVTMDLVSTLGMGGMKMKMGQGSM
ncbi:MAG: nitrous oxide reductase accessory protein NosL [Proteobacteria bacterium]|nr:nitrous oxide reductase accessory protein NosL [Pseudomonadota bacterium]MBU1739543.1 nitrous oxide reductase accessory protein NosL [Pseudomonadota bacterium]